MKDDTINNLPPHYLDIHRESIESGFGMPSDKQTGALLRALASSKPNGLFLELGTGTGLGITWLLDGMDNRSSLVSIDKNRDYQRIAIKYLSSDPRVQIIEADGLEFIQNQQSEKFDFIYADTFPGKYFGFDHTLRILKRGGIVVLDDMLPQPNWPEDHPPKVEKLLHDIDMLSADKYSIVRMAWYTGHIIITKK